ncbi:MAG: glycosyltransferase family A protein, partial [Pseudomonadota bacterium]
MPKKPLLSIGMPVYNGDTFLAETLENLLGQTFGDFDLVISDNASTDGTRDICEAFAAKDSRVSYHLQERNVGAGPNHNYVVHASTAPLFKMAAHDDLHAPTYLEKCVAVLNEDPDVVLSHSDSTLIGNEGVPLTLDPETQMFDDPITGEKLPHEPVDVAEGESSNERFSEVLHKFIWCSDMYGVMRREALNQTSLFRSFYGSDKVFLAEMALLGKFHHVREVLFLKRYHSEMS